MEDVSKRSLAGVSNSAMCPWSRTMTYRQHRLSIGYYVINLDGPRTYFVVVDDGANAVCDSEDRALREFTGRRVVRKAQRTCAVLTA